MDSKLFRKKNGITAIVVVAIIGASIFLLQEGDAQYNVYTGTPKALIIDQLYDDMPNSYFHERATEYLEMGGYETDIVTTKDITVDFYKELPNMNYKYIVIRTHGAESIDDVVLFTGERYDEENYISEQLFGQAQITCLLHFPASKSHMLEGFMKSAPLPWYSAVFGQIAGE